MLYTVFIKQSDTRKEAQTMTTSTMTKQAITADILRSAKEYISYWKHPAQRRTVTRISDYCLTELYCLGYDAPSWETRQTVRAILTDPAGSFQIASYDNDGDPIISMKESPTN